MSWMKWGCVLAQGRRWHTYTCVILYAVYTGQEVTHLHMCDVVCCVYRAGGDTPTYVSCCMLCIQGRRWHTYICVMLYAVYTGQEVTHLHMCHVVCCVYRAGGDTPTYASYCMLCIQGRRWHTYTCVILHAVYFAPVSIHSTRQEATHLHKHRIACHVYCSCVNTFYL